MKRLFSSFLAPLFEEFIMSRQAAGQWCKTYDENLHRFDNYITGNYPDTDILTDGMTSWCKPRPTENGNSCRVRTTVVWNFIDYAIKRNWTRTESRRDPTKMCRVHMFHITSHKKNWVPSLMNVTTVSYVCLCDNGAFTPC